ncbi:MAG: DUF4416 family protein [Spirochaetes bacterium]|nr:DUF4416 family protein [Spirochaetota bacterium]
MGIPKIFGKEFLVMGILLSRGANRDELLESLTSGFGPIDEMSPEELFLWTHYYDGEMGEGIHRLFVLFRDPVDPSDLAGIKTRTDKLEFLFSGQEKRRVNLDPGLLAPGRFVLATTKDRAHRIPLADGIYAELTLIYEKGAFHALPWTYPDWASEPVTSMLARWRKKVFHRDHPELTT